MPPLTLLAVSPETQLEFAAPAGGGPIGARLRLTNTSDNQVAYKVKSTAASKYVIKPSSGSISKGEVAEVIIAQKPREDGQAPEAASASKKPDRFLVQAAVVDTEEKKQLLHAAGGKAAGLAKFWDLVPKANLEEKQLEAATAGAGGQAKAAPATDAAAPAAAHSVPQGRAGGMAHGPPGKGVDRRVGPYPQYNQGMPAVTDVDDIISKMSLPGRAQLAANMTPGDLANAPPGMGGDEEMWVAPPQRQRLNSAPEEVEYPTEALPAVTPPQPLPPQQPRKAFGPRRKEDSVLQKHSRPVTFVTLDPLGQVLFTCGKDKLVLAWTMPNGEYMNTFEGHRGAVWACSVSPDGALMLSCGADSMVLMWDVATAQQLCELQLSGVGRFVEWGPMDGSGFRRAIACCNSFKNRPAAVTLLEFAPECVKGAAPQSRLTIEEPTLPSSATQVAWAGPLSQCICSVHAGGEVLFWHAGTGALLTRLEAHDGPTSMVAFSQDRTIMASCGRTDMQVRIWDLSAGLALGKPRLLQSCLCDRPLNAIALRPSICQQDFTAARAGLLRPQCDCLVGGGQDARDVALVGAGTDDQFDPLPLRLGTADNCLTEYHVYGADDPKGHKGGGHFGPIHCLTFSWDSMLSVSGSEDGNVRLRELFAAGLSDVEGAHPTLGTVQLPSRAMDMKEAMDNLPGLLAEASAEKRFVALSAFEPSVLGWPLGSPQRPLPLQRGQEVELVEDLGDGWARGRHVGTSPFMGLFPKSVVVSLAKYHEMLLVAQAELAAMPAAALGEAGAAKKEEDGDCAQS